MQSAEDTRGAADYSTFPIFCKFAAGVGITMRGLLKIQEEQQIIKLYPFSSVDLLQTLKSPNVQSAEDIGEEADY